jgi:hypothetical protein
MLRLLLLLILFGAISLSALVFEAASKTQDARNLLAASDALQGSPLRAQMLSRAANVIETSWAQPAQWHAGAAEALSSVYALQAEASGGDSVFFSKSIAAATRAVALAPVQPQAWARLAAFAQMDLPDVPCSVGACLAMSWRSARMTDPQTACVRLRIAHAEGLLNGPNDERITWYVRSGAGAEDIARCLDFLPRDALFRRLIEAR